VVYTSIITYLQEVEADHAHKTETAIPNPAKDTGNIAEYFSVL